MRAIVFDLLRACDSPTSGFLTAAPASYTLVYYNRPGRPIGTTTMQTKTGNRVVIIGSTSSAPSNNTQGELLDQQRATPRRIVVIKDGRFVGVEPAR